MARRRDPVGEELRAIRKKLNERLYRAYKAGRLEAEVRTLEREGEHAYRQAVNGMRNGRSKSRK
jgi:hypothetical protein